MLITKIFKNPIKTFIYAIAKLNKKYLYQRYSKLSKKQGINKLYFILSFDCDTHEDAKYALEVHEKLHKIGITPIYAVPGKMLEKNSHIYQKLSLQGSEFMNHGYYEHTYFDDDLGDYKSNFFYNELNYSQIEEDIVLGDQTIAKIIGKKAIGYRAPHFGVFQQSDQLSFLYNILKKLNYQYSSSTIPYHSFINGAFYQQKGLIEFPVTGTYQNPMAILDTWAYFKAPNRVKNEADYKKDIRSMLDYYMKNNIIGIINIYADILHIQDSDDFFEAMEILSKSCINTDYAHILKEIK